MRVNEVWASSSQDVFLATTRFTNYQITDVRVAHFNGVDWTETSVPWTDAAGAVWASGPDDAYVAAGTLDHFNGAEWTALPLTAYRVTGTASNNVFIANSDTVLRFSGADWDTLQTLNDEFPTALVATPDGSLFLGTDEKVLIWNGTTWIDTGFPAVNCVGKICAFSFGDAYVEASCGSSEFYHWDGQHWSFQPVPEGVAAIGGTSGSDLYAVGQLGLMLHHDGANWKSLPRVTGKSLYRVCGTPSGVAVAGDNKVLWLDESGARVLHEPDVRDGQFRIAAESSSHFMLSDESTIYRYDAGTWRETPLPFFGGQIDALGGRSMQNMYVGFGDGLVGHYDGTSWSRVDTVAVPQDGFWVTPSGAAYSVGDGAVYRRTSNWDKIKSEPSYFYLVTGDGEDGVITLARPHDDPDHIMISHLDSRGWHDLPAPDDFVWDLWAGPGLDLYAATSKGVYRLTDKQFERIPGSTDYYQFIFGGAGGRVFATNPNKVAVINQWGLRVYPARGPYESVQAADGSIVANIGHELAVWRP